MNSLKHKALISHLVRGRVYRRDELALYSHSVDRELKKLELEETLKKVGPGLYYYPKESPFGPLPPNEHELLSKFLKSHHLLLLSNNWYNSLGLGLTQLSTKTRVYNTKRYEKLSLAGQQYYFVRPNNGFPKKISPEFLLVDLMNNLDQVGEDVSQLTNRVTKKIDNFDKKQLSKLSEKYGKIKTRKFFRGLLHDSLYSRTTKREEFVLSNCRKSQSALSNNNSAIG
jgi:hypothetical protein